MIKSPQPARPGQKYVLSGRVPSGQVLKVVDAHSLRVLAEIAPETAQEFERPSVTFVIPTNVWMMSVQWSDGVVDPMLTPVIDPAANTRYSE